jgi:hypothetical protein
MPKFLPSKWANNLNIFLNIFGSISNCENRLDFFIQNIKSMCHENFQNPVTFVLGCRGGPEIRESLCSIKG